LDHLDDLVKIIKASPHREQAKKEIIAKYEFTDRQATAVLELRLYQLTGLEREKIEKEYAELQAKIARYRAILASEVLVREIIVQELGEIQKGSISERKTRITAAEGELNMEDLIADEAVIITISNDDYIKRMPMSTFREQRRGGQGVIGMDMKKDTDAIKEVYVASTHDNLIIFTSFGRCHWLKVWQIPEAGRRTKGKPLVNLLEGLGKEEKIAAVLRVKSFEEEDVSILLTTSKGIVKKTILSAFSSPRKKGVYAINIDEGDEVNGAHLVRKGQQVMLFTKWGMAVRFEETLVRPIGRVARGVRGVKLKDETDCVVSSAIVSGDETLLIVCENGYGKRSQVEQFRQTNRGGVGVRSIITSKRNGAVIGAISVKELDSVLMMSAIGQTVRMCMKDLRVMGRSTQGVKVVNLRANDHLVALQKIEHIETEEIEGEKSKS
ncbi:MAG: DNA gyrase subunit A, partial [Simkaniaceae bacterium]|nr:DNA gyrase subunit A [Simkaniaceae bacterium]